MSNRSRLLNTVTLTGFLAAAIACATTADAAVLVRYQFGTGGQETNAETGAAYAPTITDPAVTATSITDPANTVGIEISSAATAPASAPFLRVDPQGNSATPADAFTNNKYFQFAVTAAPGQDVDLGSLTFDVARGGGATPRGFFVRTSADNFATTLTATGTPALGTNGFGYDVNTARPTFTAVTVDLSAPAFQDIQNLAGSTLTFRIYSYSPNAGASVDYDNITLNAIPEPAAVALAVPLLALLPRRRRA